MAPHSSLVERISSRQDMLRVLAILAAVLVVMAVLTVVLGVTNSGPSYELIADPGPGLPV
ncbi:MAG TPA: hypothetical protein VK194_07645 [Candidatus Deferrimicrobium sp.]|nr:hypothetical protein [Candidatus Deferrimicrobium sp.]